MQNKTAPIRRKPSNKNNGCLGFVKIGCSAVFLIAFIAVLVVGIRTFTLFSHAKGGLLNTDEKKGKPESIVEITIPEGASLKEISNILYDNGIIESPFFFRWKCGAEDYSGSFNYGTFTVSNYMSFSELAEVLSGNGVDDDYFRLTITEGSSIFDIAQKLEETGICTQDEFFDVCDSGEFDYDFIEQIPDRENRLEGYLFPDTYFISDDMGAWDVVNLMLSNFNTKVAEGAYAEAADGEYSLDEIVIIASIIEKEIKYADEMAIAASVIYNRLDIGMKLQMDATVLYAKQEHQSRVWEADTEIESLYNTYYTEGLPIGPIGNAGLASFEAALHPADTDYIYYVLEDPSTGQHYFTDNYDDFLDAKNKYLSGL